MQHALKAIEGGFSTSAVANVARQITAPRLGILLQHWHEVRGRGRMPGWQDIDPAQLLPVLPVIWAWSYERDSGEFAGRLLGDRIPAVAGRSITGLSMAEYYQGWNYEEIYAVRRRIVDEPAIGLERGQVFRANGQIGLGERLMLPLARDGRHADTIIGATSFELRPDFLAETTVSSSGNVPSNDAAPACYLGGTTSEFFPL